MLNRITVTALLQTLVRGSAEPSLGAMYIDVSFPRPSSRPRLGILVTWLLIDLVLLTKSFTITIKNYYLLPLIGELINRLLGVKIFIKLDLKDIYY